VAPHRCEIEQQEPVERPSLGRAEQSAQGPTISHDDAQQLQLSQFGEGCEHLAGHGRLADVQAGEHRGDHLAGAVTVVLGAATEPMADEIVVDGAVVRCRQVPARLARGFVEGKMRSAIECECHAAQADAAIAIAAQGRVGHRKDP